MSVLKWIPCTHAGKQTDMQAGMHTQVLVGRHTVRQTNVIEMHTYRTGGMA